MKYKITLSVVVLVALGYHITLATVFLGYMVTAEMTLNTKLGHAFTFSLL